MVQIVKKFTLGLTKSFKSRQENKLRVGYIRVSSVDQNTDRQLDGIELDKRFEEKVSGTTMDREQLKRCMEFLREGDTLFVHSMDRLARNLEDLLKIVKDLTSKSVVVEFVTEKMTFTDESNPTGFLMLSLFGAIHQFELANLKIRQMEGIRKAQERGQHLGRVPIKPSKVKKIRQKREDGESIINICRDFNMAQSTVYKYTKKDKRGEYEIKI